MRTLCLKFNRPISPTLAECFLKLSPQIVFRSPHYVFIEISKTSHRFGGEQGVLAEALNLAKKIQYGFQSAIADQPYMAQAYTSYDLSYVSRPGEGAKQLSSLPLSSLKDLEGLIPWSQSQNIQLVIDFFEELGVSSLGQLRSFQRDSFQQRWGKTGALLWKRLHGQEEQKISLLNPEEKLTEYQHFDFSVSMLSYLLYAIEKKLENFMLRLQGRGEFCTELDCILYCEYSGQKHKVTVRTASPCRDIHLFMKLLEGQLEGLDFENPIKEFELEVRTCPERVQQLDFWKPQIESEEKLNQLISLFRQNQVEIGYLKAPEEIMPEDSWAVVEEYEEPEEEQSLVVNGESFQLKTVYSDALKFSPRPNLILKNPKRLSQSQVKRFEFIQPIERLEDSWWHESRGRDYFWAKSAHGENLWVYFDRVESQYFVHGYFD